MTPGCSCEECRARWIADVVEYAAFLEEMVLEIEMVLDQPDSDWRVRRMIEGLAAVAKRRALCAEIEAAVREEDRRHAAKEQAAGRLH